LFWQIQNDRDYTRLVKLFADDAVLEDPIYGRFEGREAIGEFMAKMNEATEAANMHFDALEIAGDDHTAWCRWVARSPKGDRNGVGIYKVANSKLTFYQDFIESA